MAFTFEKLVVYQKSVTFADDICTLTKDLPRGYFFLANQINRALSIPANIAEGNGRFTKPDRRNFFGIARGSDQECVPMLELSLRQGLIDPDRRLFFSPKVGFHVLRGANGMPTGTSALRSGAFPGTPTSQSASQCALGCQQTNSSLNRPVQVDVITSQSFESLSSSRLCAFAVGPSLKNL